MNDFYLLGLTVCGSAAAGYIISKCSTRYSETSLMAYWIDEDKAIPGTLDNALEAGCIPGRYKEGLKRYLDRRNKVTPSGLTP
jgi:hypothetical protein